MLTGTEVYLDGSLVFRRFGSRGRLPVVPGRLVQTGTKLGIRLPRATEGVVSTPAPFTPGRYPFRSVFAGRRSPCLSMSLCIFPARFQG